MITKKYPKGWSQDKAQRIATHYEHQTQDQAVAEDEAGVAPSVTVMNVPHDLLAQVRELIAKQKR